jgi:hypothetical protein
MAVGQCGVESGLGSRLLLEARGGRIQV